MVRSEAQKAEDKRGVLSENDSDDSSIERLYMEQKLKLQNKGQGDEEVEQARQKGDGHTVDGQGTSLLWRESEDQKIWSAFSADEV